MNQRALAGVFALSLGALACDSAARLFPCSGSEKFIDVRSDQLPEGDTPLARIRQSEFAAYRKMLDTDFSWLAADCPSCSDADRDGLADQWEAVVLARLQPFVRLHDSEPILCSARSELVALGRITPAPGGNFRAFFVLLYSEDYGSCGFTSHLGDAERVVIDLAVVPGTYSLEIAGVYTAAHEYTQTDGSTLVTGGQLIEVEWDQRREDRQPRMTVVASAGKHATYISEGDCNHHASEPCFAESCPSTYEDDGSNSILFPLLQVGEPGRPLYQQLHGYPVPVIDPWSGAPFCGFDSRTGLGTCGGPILDKLVRDPFRPGHPPL